MDFLKLKCVVLILCIFVGNRNRCLIFYRFVGDVLFCIGFLFYLGLFN